MPSIGELLRDLRTTIEWTNKKLLRTMHTGVVLQCAAVLENNLERAFKKKMRPLSKKMEKRLYDSYGPVSTFAAKIDFAFAFEIIPHRAQ
jgi:hypothetical protein